MVQITINKPVELTENQKSLEIFDWMSLKVIEAHRRWGKTFAALTVTKWALEGDFTVTYIGSNIGRCYDVTKKIAKDIGLNINHSKLVFTHEDNIPKNIVTDVVILDDVKYEPEKYLDLVYEQKVVIVGTGTKDKKMLIDHHEKIKKFDVTSSTERFTKQDIKALKENMDINEFNSQFMLKHN